MATRSPPVQSIPDKIGQASDCDPLQTTVPQEEAACFQDAVSIKHRKQFGQVFTPRRVAYLMADWIALGKPATILDPTVGLGSLAGACLHMAPNAEVHCFDLDPVILSYIPASITRYCSVSCRDFLTAPVADTYDAVIMNPPYVRHRGLREHEARRNAIASASGCPIPRSANLYVDFVLKALTTLRAGGRAAILIPSEWMSANFAGSLKRKLIDSGWLRGVVTFNHGSRIFSTALTTASLLLIEKRDVVDDVMSYYLNDIDAEQVPESLAALAAMAPPRRVPPRALRDAAKWEPLLRGSSTTLPAGWTTLGTLASSRRGIATGANGFFLVDRKLAERAGLRQANLSRCIGRARDVVGLVFRPEDFERLNDRDAKVWLLDFALPPDRDEQTYVHQGEQAGLTNRFILRMRKPWFSMEQREPSAIWAAVFTRGDVRFVHNAATVKSLTNFHCLYPRRTGETFARALVATLNSSAVRQALVNHRRGFGGGLMKFEPNDLTHIPVPDLRLVDQDLLERLAASLDGADALVREGAIDPLASIDRIVNSI